MNKGSLFTISLDAFTSNNIKLFPCSLQDKEEQNRLHVSGNSIKINLHKKPIFVYLDSGQKMEYQTRFPMYSYFSLPYLVLVEDKIGIIDAIGKVINWSPQLKG